MKKGYLLWLAMVYATCSIAQVNFYVSPTGSNSNPGTITQPWKTFQKACDAATPGSTVFLRGGTYAKAVLNVNGTSGNYITFTNYPGETAVIDGGNAKRTLFYAKNKSYIKVVGLEFRNAVGNYSIGIEFEGKCSYIEILNNRIHDIHFNVNPAAVANSNKNTNPLVIYGTDSLIAANHILISGNTIYNCRTGYSEACTVNGNVDGWEIINNTIHDITNIGIDASGGYKVSKNVALDVARNGVIRGNVVYNCKSPYASAAGIYADGADDVLIERNICYNNQYGFEIGCEEKNSIASGIIMRENIAYNNDEAGIALGGYNYPNTGKVDDCYINNNTFYNNDLTQKGQGELVLTHLENSVFINNIMHGGNKRLLFNSAIGNLLGNTFDYNNWFTIDTDSTKPMFKINGSNYKTFADYVGSALGWDSHSVFGNPNFVSGADFHLTTGSFAYNLGDPAFVAGLGETDFDLAPRKYDNRVDAGAYESQVPLRSTVSTYESKILTVYPNPCTTVLNISCDAEVQKIRVLNLSGNEVIVLPPIQILNIENFTSGFYILEVITSDQTILRKTFIKR